MQQCKSACHEEGPRGLSLPFQLSSLLMQWQPLCSVANLFWHPPRCKLTFTLGHFSAAQLPSHMLSWKVTLPALVGKLSRFGWQLLPLSPFYLPPIGSCRGGGAFKNHALMDMHSRVCAYGQCLFITANLSMKPLLNNLIPRRQCNKLMFSFPLKDCW